MTTPATLHYLGAMHGLAVRQILGHGWVCHSLGSCALMTLGWDLERASSRLLLIAAALGRGATA